MAKTRRSPLQIRGAHTEAQVDARVTDMESRNQVAHRDLDRYYDLLNVELARVDLTAQEASLIAEALRDVWLQDRAYRYIRQVVEDACGHRGLGSLHGLDKSGQARLIETMRTWTPAQSLAVADAVERFAGTPGATVASVGLVSMPTSLGAPLG